MGEKDQIGINIWESYPKSSDTRGDASTARVELRPSGGHTYAVVVEDYRDADGRTRKRVLHSFGNARDPAAVAEAQKYAATVNGISALKGHASDDDLKKLIFAIIGIAAGAALIAWLFGDNE